MRIHCLALFLACSASQYPVFKVLRFKPKPESQRKILPVPPSGVKNFFGKVSRSVSPGPARPACARGGRPRPLLGEARREHVTGSRDAAQEPFSKMRGTPRFHAPAIPIHLYIEKPASKETGFAKTCCSQIRLSASRTAGACGLS